MVRGATGAGKQQAEDAVGRDTDAHRDQTARNAGGATGKKAGTKAGAGGAAGARGGTASARHGLTLDLPAPGTACGGAARHMGGAAAPGVLTGAPAGASNVKDVDGLRSEVTAMLKKLEADINTSYKDQLNSAVRALEERIHNTATKHYQDVQAGVEASQKAMSQAREHHKRVMSEVQGARDATAAGGDAMLTSARDSVAGVLAGMEGELGRLRKKYKL